MPFPSEDDGVEVEKIGAEFRYEAFSVRLGEESGGMGRLFEISLPVADAPANGQLIVRDDLGSGLDGSLVHAIASMFQKRGRRKNARLLFSSHDTTTLDPGLYRRDQIWFTQLRREDRSTDLHLLAEIRNVRKREGLARDTCPGNAGRCPC